MIYFDLSNIYKANKLRCRLVNINVGVYNSLQFEKNSDDDGSRLINLTEYQFFGWCKDINIEVESPTKEELLWLESLIVNIFENRWTEFI